MPQRRISFAGLLLALLALTAQLAFGAIVPRPELALVLQGGGVICHAPRPAGALRPAAAPARPIHRPTSPGSPFCPLCTALATPGLVMPVAATAPSLPRLVAFRQPGLPPPATAPPATPRSAAQPRGPPILA